MLTVDTSRSAGREAFKKAQEDQALADLISELHRCGLENAAEQLEDTITILLKTQPEYQRGTHPAPEANVLQRLEVCNLQEIRRASEVDVNTVEGRREVMTVQRDNGKIIRLVWEASRARLEPTQFLRKVADLLASDFSVLASLVQQKQGKEKTTLCIHACDIREVEARIRDIIADNEEHVRALLKGGAYAREIERLRR